MEQFPTETMAIASIDITDFNTLKSAFSKATAASDSELLRLALLRLG